MRRSSRPRAGWPRMPWVWSGLVRQPQGLTSGRLFCLECSGLVVYADGPLNLDRKAEDMSELFRPFHTLLRKIRWGWGGGQGAAGRGEGWGQG